MKGQHDLNIKSAFLHLMYDALISAGVVVSGILIYFTHAWWIDPVVGLLIVITILYGSWGLLRQSLDLILDAVPRAINLKDVRDYLLSHHNITAVHDLHIWGLSTKETALTAHLIVPNNDMDHVQLDNINAELKKHFKIHHTTLQVEMNEAGCERETECC
jgi:cobalt-zinc-cadmium efflux system protein